LPAFQHYADIRLEITGLDATYDIRERPSPVGRDQIEDRGNRGGETANDELAVEQNRGDLGALERLRKSELARSSSSILLLSSVLTVCSSAGPRLERVRF
jgi:hypothetical protein